MRSAALLAALVLSTLAGCGSQTPTTDVPDGGATQDVGGPPAPSPTPDGPVRTRDLAYVVQTGDSPELCLGVVAESAPPQCDGLSLAGWDWDALSGVYETAGPSRWGSYAVTGTLADDTLTVTGAVPAALYDPAVVAPAAPAAPTASYDAAELDDIAAQLRAEVPGVLGANAVDGRVQLDVVYDDGMLQAWSDDTFGAGVVVVTGALVDAG